jgi:hypothetical protein
MHSLCQWFLKFWRSGDFSDGGHIPPKADEETA